MAFDTSFEKELRQIVIWKPCVYETLEKKSRFSILLHFVLHIFRSIHVFTWFIFYFLLLIYFTHNVKNITKKHKRVMILINLLGQGNRSKVKVTMSKNKKVVL